MLNGYPTTQSLSAPYEPKSAMNVPRVSPYVLSMNCTETFSLFVRRLLISAILPTYHELYGGPNQQLFQ